MFVFDGPCRHPFKRDKIVNTQPLDTEFRRALLQLIDIFNFRVWHAYGEAEAECAVLQRLDIVDCILTSDVDVFLFGGKRVFREWPQKRNQKIACYDMQWIQQCVGLDRSDLILIALLRGGDYDTKGTTGVGITVAQALAKCKHHAKLFDMICNQEHIDSDILDIFRDAVKYEISSGCQGRVRRSSAGQLQNDFPNVEILHFYIQPKTNAEKRENLNACKDLVQWLNSDVEGDADIKKLALFCREAFGWSDQVTITKMCNLVFAGYARKRLCNRTTHPDTHSISQQHNTGSTKGKKQAALDSFYSVTKKSMQQLQRESADILRVMLDRVVGNLNLHLVEYDEHVLRTFMDTVNTALEQTTTAFPGMFKQKYNKTEKEVDHLEEDDESQGAEGNDTAKVRRKWVLAQIVQEAYPTMVKAYEASKKPRKQAQKRKSNQAVTDTNKQTCVLDFFKKQESKQ